MQFTDMELAIIEGALRKDASDCAWSALRLFEEGENDAAELSCRAAAHRRDLADKIANRF